MNPSRKRIGTGPTDEADRWADESLCAHAEGQWQRLRRQVELGSGFWLAFLFSRSPRIARVFAARLAGVYRSHVRRLLVLRAETPDQLPMILQRLGSGDADPAAAVWVRAEQGYTAAERDAWRRAWETFFLRLNEHRDQLRRQWNGALIFELPAELKPIVRDAAPDLWSIRAIVLEPVEIGTREDAAAISRPNDQPPAEQQPTDAFAEPLHARVRRSAAGEPEAWELAVRTRLRDIGGWMTAEQTAKAVEAARETVEILESHDTAHALLSDALTALAEAEQADGDDAAALDHYRRLFSLNAATDDRSLLEHLQAAARSAANVGRPDLVRSFADRQEQIARHRVQQYGENAQTLRDLSISLDNLGDMRRESGDMAGAEAAFAESLEIHRRLIEQYGATPRREMEVQYTFDRLQELLPSRVAESAP